jgi:hypothetical protein
MIERHEKFVVNLPEKDVETFSAIASFYHLKHFFYSKSDCPPYFDTYGNQKHQQMKALDKDGKEITKSFEELFDDIIYSKMIIPLAQNRLLFLSMHIVPLNSRTIHL